MENPDKDIVLLLILFLRRSDRVIPDIPNFYSDNRIGWIVTNPYSLVDTQIREVVFVVLTPLVLPWDYLGDGIFSGYQDRWFDTLVPIRTDS